jgi:hypothetical protein
MLGARIKCGISRVCRLWVAVVHRSIRACLAGRKEHEAPRAPGPKKPSTLDVSRAAPASFGPHSTRGPKTAGTSFKTDSERGTVPFRTADCAKSGQSPSVLKPVLAIPPFSRHAAQGMISEVRVRLKGARLGQSILLPLVDAVSRARFGHAGRGDIGLRRSRIDSRGARLAISP